MRIPVEPSILVLNWRDLRNPLAGGGEVHVWRVFQEAVRRGWRVQAICCGFPGAAREEVVEGIPVLRCGSELTYAAHVPFAYPKARRLFRPDLVFEVMDKLPLMTPLYVREPSVCFLHHFFGDAAPVEVSWPVARVVQTAERLVPLVYRRVPFMTGSASATRELVALGIPEENVQTQSYGVDVEVLGQTAKTPSPSIVYVGRLRRYKQVDHLLRAAASLKNTIPQLRVDIVGTGDAEPELVRLSAELGIADRVTFHGHSTESDRRELMGRSWVACLPSMKEGFGLTIPEAALCGTPTVGYDVPGVCDAIVQNETGLLARRCDWRSLQEGLGAVLCDNELRLRLARQALRRYESFTWARAAETTVRAMESLLASPGVAASLDEVPQGLEAVCVRESQHEMPASPTVVG